MERVNEPIELTDALWQGGHFVISCLFNVVSATRAVILCILSTLYNSWPRRYGGGSEVTGEDRRELQPADHGDILLQEGAELHGFGPTALV